MLHDTLGNPITGADETARAGVDDFVMGFLAYETRAAGILETAAAAPGCALAQIYAGMLWMFLESPEAPGRAAAFIEAADALPMDAREALNLAFLKAWAADAIPEAIAIAEEAGARFPRDLVLLKLGQYHAFNRGDAAAMLRLVLQVLPAARDVAYAHGMAAFAYEQCHLLEEAEAAARTALALQPREPWAQHALAHVMLTQGRIAEGAAFMEACSAGWAGLNSFMSTHNWWHLALFRLSLGEEAAVLEIYDRHVWGIAPDYSQDQVGAVALLGRLEFAGMDVGARWQALAPWLKARVGDAVQPFLSLFYLYGLARVGAEEADILMRTMRNAAQHGPQHARAAWADVAVPAGEGLLALAGGRPHDAARLIAQALPRMAEIGGSHAQRDFFEQARLEALLQAQAWSQAQQILEERRRFDPVGVPLNRTLARVYRALGLPAQAAAAQARLSPAPAASA